MGSNRQIVLLATIMALSAFSDVNAYDVVWSGFAFQGDYKSGSARYPVSVKLSNQKIGNVSRFDITLKNKLGNLRNDSFNLKFDELGSVGPDSASSTALAFVLDRGWINDAKNPVNITTR